MRFFTLASSSSGNCSFFGDSSGGLLIDAGISARRITTILKERGISPHNLEGILITHEHTDHIKGLSVFTKQNDIPIYGDMAVLRYLRGHNLVAPDAPLVPITAGKEHRVGRFEVLPIPTCHDAICPLGYRMSLDDSTAAILTDTGCTNPGMTACLAGVQLILLESNYEPAMLTAGCYPYALKRRISSDTGHLSNEQSSVLSRHLLEKGTTRFVLGHLSKENNLPLLAHQAARRGFDCTGATDGRDYILTVAPADEPMDTVLF